MFFWSIIVYLLISTVSFAQNPPSRSGKSVFDFDKDSRIKRHSMAKLESPFFLERKDISDILTNILAENKPKDRFETTGDFKNRSNSFIKNFIFKKRIQLLFPLMHLVFLILLDSITMQILKLYLYTHRLFRASR